MFLLKYLHTKIVSWLFILLFLLLPQENLYSLFQSTLDNRIHRDSLVSTEPQPELFYGFQKNDMHIVRRKIQQNQRFIDLLKGYRVKPHVRQQIHLLPRKTFDFRKIVTNKTYTLLVDSDSLRTIKALVYEPNMIDYLVFHMEDSFFIERCQRDVVYVEKNIVGIIQSNLSETIEALNISHQITNRFVDIFAWQIDFQQLQKGDLFKLVYEERTVDGIPIGIGDIKVAYFDHAGSGYCAFSFDQGNGVDYFDEEGKSLQKALLKYPIQFTRISSRYTRRRFHPIAKRFRAHLGTDFAAAMGTPIRAVGDGVVIEARYKLYNGNYVKLRHNNIYTTQYLHMSKIASGIRKGVKVHQGKIIGFVGKTGLATGPHLCYRFWRNNIQVDALKVQLPSSRSITEKYKSVFLQEKQQLISQLDSISITRY